MDYRPVAPRCEPPSQTTREPQGEERLGEEEEGCDQRLSEIVHKRRPTALDRVPGELERPSYDERCAEHRESGAERQGRDTLCATDERRDHHRHRRAEHRGAAY